jgi:hypothetical protein
MIESDKTQDINCTDLLMGVLEEFGNCEAKSVIVLYLNENDEIILRRNTGNSLTIGLCDYGKQVSRRCIFKEDV